MRGTVQGLGGEKAERFPTSYPKFISKALQRVAPRGQFFSKEKFKHAKSFKNININDDAKNQKHENTVPQTPGEFFRKHRSKTKFTKCF